MNGILEVAPAVSLREKRHGLARRKAGAECGGGTTRRQRVAGTVGEGAVGLPYSRPHGSLNLGLLYVMALEDEPRHGCTAGGARVI